LTATNTYTITFSGVTYPVLADGTVSSDPEATPVALGAGVTEITGLVNGVEYMVTQIV